MRRMMWREGGAAALSMAGLLAGCVGDNTGMTPGSLGTQTVPAVDAVAPAPPPVAMGPLLEGPIGAKLAMADRQSAFTAETQALESGERKTWRGSRGTYGFVVPGGATAGGADCRSFTHTIYFAGRPQTATGTGCKDPDGSWRIVG